MSETCVTSSRERSLMFFGLGGQGMQLAGKILARAVLAEGRYAMLAADYGGEMRGGPSNITLVVGPEPVDALPILPVTQAAVVAHPQFCGVVPERLAPNGTLLLNSSVARADGVPPGIDVHVVAATDAALSIGSSQVTGLILLGAVNQILGLAEPESVRRAMEETVPAHRAKLIPTNRKALELGRELAQRPAAAPDTSAADRAPEGAMS